LESIKFYFVFLWHKDRPERSTNPKTAAAEFLKTNSDFVVDQAIDEKLLISAAPGGYLKRIK